MAQIRRFEDIEAWKQGRELTREVYRLARRGPLAREFVLRDQMCRAAVSIVSNIAEGFGRGGDREFRQFLSQAKGSAAELQAQLYVAADAGVITAADFDHLYRRAERICKVLSGFIIYLGEPDKRGHKYKSVPT